MQSKETKAGPKPITPVPVHAAQDESNKDESRPEFPMHQATHEGEAQIEERLEQLESEHMKKAELLIRHNYVSENSNGDSGGRFQQASRRLAELQEQVEEFMCKLFEAQAVREEQKSI